MPDAIVIGSVPNGLAAAIRLAEAGRSVTVLEASDTPGGAVRTEELTLPGFHHDVMSAVYPAGAASPVFGRMPLADFGLEWVHPEVCLRAPARRRSAARRCIATWARHGGVAQPATLRRRRRRAADATVHRVVGRGRRRRRSLFRHCSAR